MQSQETQTATSETPNQDVAQQQAKTQPEPTTTPSTIVTDTKLVPKPNRHQLRKALAMNRKNGHRPAISLTRQERASKKYKRKLQKAARKVNRK